MTVDESVVDTLTTDQVRDEMLAAIDAAVAARKRFVRVLHAKLHAEADLEEAEQANVDAQNEMKFWVDMHAAREDGEV